jgi:hypothetical protein
MESQAVSSIFYPTLRKLEELFIQAVLSKEMIGHPTTL